MAIGVAAAVAIALAVVGALQLRHASTFAIRDVRVEGVSRVTTETVVRLADVAPGATLIDVDRQGIARRVATDPWVASAQVDRDFPHTLVINVTERKPGAWVRVSRKSTWLVSTDSTWLKERSKGETLPLVTITDVEGLTPQVGADVQSEEITNVLAVLRGLSPALRSIVKFASAPTVEETALVTKNGVQIFVGPASQMKKKDAVVRAILAQQKGKLVYINVRTPDRPTWRGLTQP